MKTGPRCPLRVWLAALGVASLVPLAACTAASTSDETAPQAQPAAIIADAEPPEPALVFINLLPWGKIDFQRGEFPSLGDCNALVRSFPDYSFYTTSERCEPIDDPVHCTVWQDGDDTRAQIDCFKGAGGCEIELRRHDLLAERGTRTVTARCAPFSLADAWGRYQVSAPAEPGSTGTP